jgi:hypothetical protein
VAIAFEHSGESEMFSIFSDVDYSNLLTLNIDPNPTDAMSYGSVTVYVNGRDYTIQIFQDGQNARIDLSQTTISTCSDGGVSVIDVMSNVAWTP